MTIIIGVDPGLTRCGFALLESKELLDVGVIATSKDDPQEQRLLQMDDGLNLLFERAALRASDMRTDLHLAIERPFLTAHNPDTGFGTAQVVGQCMLKAARGGITLSLLTPAQVKAAVTGSGAAKKEQIGRAVQQILQLDEIPSPADAADAVAVALAAEIRGVGSRASTTGRTAITPAQKKWQDALSKQQLGRRRV